MQFDLRPYTTKESVALFRARFFMQGQRVYGHLSFGNHTIGRFDLLAIRNDVGRDLHVGVVNVLQLNVEKTSFGEEMEPAQPVEHGSLAWQVTTLHGPCTL